MISISIELPKILIFHLTSLWNSIFLSQTQQRIGVQPLLKFKVSKFKNWTFAKKINYVLRCLSLKLWMIWVYSYVSTYFIEGLNMIWNLLNVHIHIFTLVGDSMIIYRAYCSCVAMFMGYKTSKGLLILDMVNWLWYYLQDQLSKRFVCPNVYLWDALIFFYKEEGWEYAMCRIHLIKSLFAWVSLYLLFFL